MAQNPYGVMKPGRFTHELNYGMLSIAIMNIRTYSSVNIDVHAWIKHQRRYCLSATVTVSSFFAGSLEGTVIYWITPSREKIGLNQNIGQTFKPLYVLVEYPGVAPGPEPATY